MKDCPEANVPSGGVSFFTQPCSTEGKSYAVAHILEDASFLKV